MSSAQVSFTALPCPTATHSKSRGRHRAEGVAIPELRPVAPLGCSTPSWATPLVACWDLSPPLVQKQKGLVGWVLRRISLSRTAPAMGEPPSFPQVMPGREAFLQPRKLTRLQGSVSPTFPFQPSDPPLSLRPSLHQQTACRAGSLPRVAPAGCRVRLWIWFIGEALPPWELRVSLRTQNLQVTLHPSWDLHP